MVSKGCLVVREPSKDQVKGVWRVGSVCMRGTLVYHAIPAPRPWCHSYTTAARMEGYSRGISSDILSYPDAARPASHHYDRKSSQTSPIVCCRCSRLVFAAVIAISLTRTALCPDDLDLYHGSQSAAALASLPFGPTRAACWAGPIGLHSYIRAAGYDSHLFQTCTCLSKDW